MPTENKTKTRTATREKTAVKVSPRELTKANKELLQPVDRGLAKWMKSILEGSTKAKPPKLAKDPETRKRLIAMLRDVQAAVEESKDVADPGKARAMLSKTLEDKYEAATEAKNEVLSSYLEYTRPVEQFYFSLNSLFESAEGEAKILVVPILPEEVDDDAYDVSPDGPNKVELIREIMKRNDYLNPDGWIGLLPVPIGFEGEEYGQFHKEMVKLAEKRNALVVAALHPEDVDEGKTSLDALMEEMSLAESPHGVLASGTDPRIVHIHGDVVARERRGLAEPGGELEAEHLTIPPTMALVGAICRNDKTDGRGIQQPPASIDEGSKIGLISGFRQPVREVTRINDEVAKKAHNNPQRINVLVKRKTGTYVYGSTVSGDTRFDTYEVRRILDKLDILVKGLLLNEHFKAVSNTTRAKNILEDRVKKILLEQKKAGAIQKDYKVTAVKTEAEAGDVRQEWNVIVSVAPSAVITAFNYDINTGATEGEEG